MTRAPAIPERLLAALARGRLAVGAVAFLVIVFGLITLTHMPLRLLPEVRYPQIRIIGDLPGQTSRVIEESINEPMEAAVAGLPGLVQLESRSGDGRAYIDLFFEPGHDLDRALRDVIQAAQRARTQVPDAFPDPRIFAVSTLEEPALQFAFGSSAMSVEEIRRRLRAHLLPRLRGVSGVDMVFMGREENQELVIDVDPDQLNAMGGDLGAVERLLLEATEPPTAGAMRTSHFEGIGILGLDGWNPEDLAARILLIGEEGGMAVPLGSVASIHRMASEERLRTRLDGQPAVLLTVHRSPRAHALRVAESVRSRVNEVSRTRAFSQIQTRMLYDDSRTTGSAVKSVLVAAIGGSTLAMLLLFFTLHQRRHVLLVALVVAVSLSATITVLHGMGLTLNLLTLAGLLLSVGLGLDYAIIYFDRLDRMRGEGDPHLAAMAQVLGPLLGALLTTLAAVLPFLLVQGLVAELFRPLIWTVAVSALFSFLIAVALLPAFARGAEPGPGGVRDGHGAGASRWWLRAQRPAVIWGAVAGLAGLAFVSLRTLPFEVLPTVDDGFIGLRVIHPAGIPAADLDALTREVEQALSGVDGTDALFTTVGGYFREGLPSYRPGTANFMARLDTRGGDRPSVEWAEAARAAVAGLDRPELRLSVTLPRIRGVKTRLADADLVVVLAEESGDLLALTEIEARVEELLNGVNGLTDVERVRGGVSPRWRMEPRHAALAHHGVPVAKLKQVMAYTLEGRILRQRMEGGEPLVLRARFDRREAGGPHHLDTAHLPSSSGGVVHLGELADFTLVEEPTHIERRENQRVVRVAAQFDPAEPGPGRVAERVRRVLAGADFPDGVSWWLEGEMDALEETRRTFMTALSLALLMVLTLLVVQYRSIPFAAAALIAIPLCGTGALLLLGIMNRPLDAMVLAGLLIAVGVVANNVILVLSQTLQGRSRDPDLSLQDALRHAARDRLRPITLTVLSTVLGMSPLIFGGAAVFGLLQPLAIALTGSLLFSIPIAVLLLPGLVSVLSRSPQSPVRSEEGISRRAP
jgi:multidrug efflux pump subunit AcrB